MDVIKSLDNNRIKKYSKLLIKKFRDSEGLFLVEGEHLVAEAFKKGILVEVIQTEDCSLSYDVLTTYVTYDVLKKLSNCITPQKVIGVCKKFLPRDVKGKVLLLDDIQDPGNLGTIIRSSVAFGVDSIVLSLNSVDVYNDKVIRSSEGMIFNINIIRDDLKGVIDRLHSDEYVVYGTKVDGGKILNQIEQGDKVAFVMGNEGAGVKKEILELCDEYLYIPMDSSCESLNVGVATSIILYEFYK